MALGCLLFFIASDIINIADITCLIHGSYCMWKTSLGIYQECTYQEHIFLEVLSNVFQKENV